ncbi:MAG: AAA family ATPase [Armatimonadetes bacterium]|nr:AAA family ATPase [Armatimonadota bacterium]
MLLQFTVENFRSFKSEAILNLIPAKSRIHPGHVLKDDASGKAVKAVPLAVVYGANASGKSTLVQALAFAQGLITRGTRGEESIPLVPFRLDKDSLSKPGRFEFVLKHDGVVYTYGFVVSATTVHEEWLFAVYQSREVRVFERITTDGKAVLEVGAALATTSEEKQRIQFVAEGTRPNQLFLTEANERNVELLKPLMRWFRQSLQIIHPQSRYQELVLRTHKDEDFTRFLGDFLRVADTGIEGIGTGSEPLDLERLFPDMPEEFGKSLLDEVAKDHVVAVNIEAGDRRYAITSDAQKVPTVFTLKTQHRTTSGESVDFETREESDGTRRVMDLVPALMDLQSNEKVYVVDELDRSMHPLLCRLYVEAFLRSLQETKSRGQMILTTHETGLLDLDLLRRDEIWFVEKDKEGGSHLTSLAEFKYKVRSDLKIARGYLNGRFGAIPFVGDVKALLPRR